MDNIREFLTRKIGPLPAWAWGIVIAAGIWILRSMRSSCSRSCSSGSGIRSQDASTFATLSGGGAVAPPPTGVGAPEGSQSSLFVSSPEFTAEGDPSTVGDLYAAYLASIRANTGTGGGGTPPAPEEPVAAPVAPTTTTRKYQLYWMNTGQVVGTYPTRLACAQAAQQAAPNSNPPGSSMGCRSV